MLTKTILIVLAMMVGIVWHAHTASAGPAGPVLINRCVPDYREPACKRRDWPEKQFGLPQDSFGR
jgi:hypothetical protein